MVRCFDDPNIIHVAGGVNPLRDIDVINTELMLADLDSVEKRYTKTNKVAITTADAKLKAEATTIKKILDALQAGRPARTVELGDDEKQIVHEMHLITQKTRSLFGQC